MSHELNPNTAGSPEPTITAVIAIEALPWGSNGSHRAVVRWSDGTTGEALSWFADEIRFVEADFFGKTQAQVRDLHFERDRSYLRGDSA